MEASKITESTSAKDFIEGVVAYKINKKPADVAKFV